MSSIKKNFSYNIALTLSTYIINLLLFPYVSRVLGVDMVGKIGFVNNTVLYFSLFALWGISGLGIREIAACGEDRNRRSQVFSELLTIISITTLVVVAIYLVTIYFVPQFSGKKDFLLIGTGSLFFTSFLIEWFYQGIEEFKYIALRTIFVRLLYAILVFLLVKEPTDSLLYYVLTMSVIVVNSFINVLYSRRFVTISFKRISLNKYIKPFFSLGLFKIMTSMYTTFNVIFLGFVCTDREVGFYYTSTKIFYIVLGFLTAFTGVMLPRMSSLLAENKESEFKQSIKRSFEFVFAVALPLVIGGVFLAPQIVELLSGPGYEGAILPMRIVMPMVLISGLAQIWVVQVLIPKREDSIILIASCIGAFVGLCANLLLVPKMGAIGSAIVLIVSELAGNTFSFVYSVHKGLFSFPISSFLKNLLCSIPYLLICIICVKYIKNPIIALCITVIFCALYFLFCNTCVLKNFSLRYLFKRNNLN